MKRTLIIVAFLLGLTVQFLGCDDDTDDGGETGSLEIAGGYSGELPDGLQLKWAVFECPFMMPPADSGVGSVTDGEVYALIDDLPIGIWCILAFIDLDEADGLKQVDGLDPTAYPPEGDDAFQVTIEADTTTTVVLDFTILSTP